MGLFYIDNFYGKIIWRKYDGFIQSRSYSEYAWSEGRRSEVFPTTQEPERFKKLKDVILDTGKEKVDLESKECKIF